MLRTLLISLFFLYPALLIAQLPYNIKDGREGSYCGGCIAVIRSMPPEVLFGLSTDSNGDIYFSMNNAVWFNKIFKNDSYGLTVDLVSKDRYTCSNNNLTVALPKGKMLPPVYRKELLTGLDKTAEGGIYVKVGVLPSSLKNKEVEGNLVILNGNLICHYTNFVNIERSSWELLPMGLFTDSLVRNHSSGDDKNPDFFSYTNTIRVEIPFEKGSTKFNETNLKKFYDSLGLSKYIIHKAEIRAYTSVEGPETVNRQLMKARADTILRALKSFQPDLARINIITAENWLEFFRDIDSTGYADMKDMSKSEIKQKLADKVTLRVMEPILAKHRKAVITLYLENKTAASISNNTDIISDFKQAIEAKDLEKAKGIQQEIAERIADNKIPLEYIKKLEIPQSKDFASLLSDREVYRYLLRATSEYEALDNFIALRKYDPDNGRINYNICALRFFVWQYSTDTISKKFLLNEIQRLPKLGINDMLVKRMLINYHILKCRDNMLSFDYSAKDISVEFIHRMYNDMKKTDEDIYSLSKYFAFYAHPEYAEELITPRVDKIDVSEDLVFYYVNLLFFQPDTYDSDEFRKACLNAINLNRKRFCDFFLPNDKGGASMQLLEYEQIKSAYCESCK